jgi:uncharacterized damage-inducible protein DinB
MKPYIEELTRYNVWANELITSYLLQAGAAIADKEQSSSFPTIRKTLYHLWDAQVIWLARLNGTSLNTWPSQSFNGTLEEAAAGLLANSEEFVRFVAESDEKALERDVVFHSLDKTEYRQKALEILFHVMNHSTYHRGQLITMLRNAGFEEVGSTDLIRYYRSR